MSPTTIAALSGLQAVRDALRQLRLPLAAPGAAEARAQADRLILQLDDYVLPRLDRLDAPLLAVVGGPTGSGKSTLVNSVVGERVTQPGVLRPTTRTPVLVHHPADSAWFTGEHVLPGLARVAGSAGTGSPTELRLVGSEAVPVGLAILDAPDIDSVVSENRALADQLMAAADLWIFTTSAARYADAVPWQVLTAAARRGAAVAVVLDRVPAGAAEAIRPDLAAMLERTGLADAPLFTVPETTVIDDRLPAEVVAPLRAWLTALVADAEARGWVVKATLRGAVLDILDRCEPVADAADEQVAVRDRLRGAVHDAYQDAGATVLAASSDGSLLRGEVLARWQELVGAGELVKAVDSWVSQARDRLGAFFRGDAPAPTPTDPAVEAIEVGLDSLIRDAADEAAAAAERRWRADPAGLTLLRQADAGGAPLGRSSPALVAAAAHEVRAWQDAVMALVREVGMAKRGRARALAFGVNGLGVALMVVTFAHTGGLVGAEVGIAAGTAVVAQRVLEAVFGDQAVRRLTEQARADLDERVRRLLGDEAARFDRLLDAAGVPGDGGDGLRAEAARVRPLLDDILGRAA